jgi:hypothetical protein
MTARDDFDRTLADWLDAEAVSPLPLGGLDQALDATRRRSPLPAWLARVGSHWIGGARSSSDPRVGPGWSRALVLLALIAVIVGSALAGTVLVGGVLGPRPGPSLVPPRALVPPPSPAAVIASPGPSSLAALLTPTPSVEPCFTDTVQVLTGDAMRAIVGGDYSGPSLAALGPGRGVYIVGFVGPSRSGLWAVGPGDGPARPIAAIAFRPLVLDILDLSPDGSTALLRIGNVHVNSPEPECADLYAVRTDGSGASRLTALGGGHPLAGAAFSPDGRRVAYSSSGRGSDVAALTALDTTTGRAVGQPCNNGYSWHDPVRIDWSPSGDRLVVTCYEALRIFDPTGVTAPVDVPPVGLILAFVWTEDGRIITATDHGFTAYDIASQTSTTLSDLDASGIELIAPAPDSLSPDGRWFTFLGGERGDVPGDNFRTVRYLVSTSGGTPTRIQNENEAGSSVSWSTDGRALISAHESGKQVEDVQELTLGRLDLDTLQWSSIGTLPGAQGIWQIP